MLAKAEFPRRRLLNVPEAAEWLYVSVHTIRQWVSRRSIPHRKVGRAVRFDPDDVQRWLDTRQVAEYSESSRSRRRR